jgi:HAD superfamily phosphoserine phosphatase-like hydrolase
MNNNKLVVFDLDNTLITGNIWEHFNTSLGVTKEQDWELYSAFTKNEITYQQWLSGLKELYRLDTNKHTKAQVLEYLTEYDLQPDALTALQLITSSGYDTLLLAGSFQMTADAVAFELGLNKAIAATTCIFDAAELLCDLHSVGNEREAKVQLLHDYCDTHDITLSDCIVVGSGGNNLALFAEVDQSITFTTSNQELQAAATHVVKNLSEVATLLSEL